MHPEPFRRGTHEFMEFYGTPIGRIGDPVRQRLRVQRDATGGGRRDPRTLRAGRRGVGEQGLARAAERVGYLGQAEGDRDPPGAAGGRRRRAQRRRARRVPDPLPRAPHRHDLPAHALHRVGGHPCRRPARPPRSLDRCPPPRRARHDARLGTGVRRRVGPARSADHGDQRRTRARKRSSTPTATRGRRSRTCASTTARSATRCRSYLDLVGCRLLDGFDISGRYAMELPDALLRSIRLSVDGAGNDTDEVDARIADIRAQVPAEHQAEFDELLGEARLMYRLRDERGVYSDIWASGIMRRATISCRSPRPRSGAHPRPRALRRRRLRRDVRAS